MVLPFICEHQLLCPFCIVFILLFQSSLVMCCHLERTKILQAFKTSRDENTIFLSKELLELGESVGTQSLGLTQELMSLLPVSKYKCSLFSRKKSRKERYCLCFIFASLKCDFLLSTATFGLPQILN
ncbi:hypothetical protein ES319_A04G042700v1 [Gossypium barbadense]|uniref:Uncharacterized protein n=1 Tax=Gossypium barbadense TaxID=3634 RepID=A0A5J5W3F6_GOSBA|nr:hypothetical protein ES319_A04G042700v1 [Gossypium barbadense]